MQQSRSCMGAMAALHAIRSHQYVRQARCPGKAVWRVAGTVHGSVDRTHRRLPEKLRSVGRTHRRLPEKLRSVNRTHRSLPEKLRSVGRTHRWLPEKLRSIPQSRFRANPAAREGSNFRVEVHVQRTLHVLWQSTQSARKPDDHWRFGEPWPYSSLHASQQPDSRDQHGGSGGSLHRA